MSHVFISYSKQNKDYARKLADHLLSQGFDVWIDDRIDYGEDWWASIVNAIRECGAFLVIMTPDSGKSRWVKREVMLAENIDKQIFPLLLEGDLHSSELWSLFIGTQYVNVTNATLPPENFLTRLTKYAIRQDKPGKEITLKTQIRATSSTSDAVLTLLDKKVDAAGKLTQAANTLAIIPPDVSSILPMPFEWCKIPAGKVTIEHSETDHKTFDVAQFWMAKYPITNAQYQVFVDAEDGYCDASWWSYSDEAKIWRQENEQPEKDGFEGAALPRTWVYWYEMVAFCQWLTARFKSSGMQIIVPTEQQWQRAAQGDDGRQYPWGNEFNKSCCNTRESGVGKPTPVTAYPQGASPYDVMDMSGNVWESCLTQTQWRNDAIDLRGAVARVLRGGSFFDDHLVARASFRSLNHPVGRILLVGFRVVCRPASP